MKFRSPRALLVISVMAVSLSSCTWSGDDTSSSVDASAPTRTLPECSSIESRITPGLLQDTYLNDYPSNPFPEVAICSVDATATDANASRTELNILVGVAGGPFRDATGKELDTYLKRWARDQLSQYCDRSDEVPDTSRYTLRCASGHRDDNAVGVGYAVVDKEAAILAFATIWPDGVSDDEARQAADRIAQAALDAAVSETTN